MTPRLNSRFSLIFLLAITLLASCSHPQGSECSSDSDCLSGYTCDQTEKKCVAPDESDTDSTQTCSCKRGVCDSDGSCVNPESCVRDTQCIADNKCHQNECKPKEDVCNDIDCSSGGVCKPETLKCENKEECSDDKDCKKDFYCDRGNSKCKYNACLNDICPRGECNKETLECKNKVSCETTVDCLPGYVCDDSGQCVEKKPLCDQECKGNQLCIDSLHSKGIRCANNPAGCETSLDCIRGEVCNKFGVCRAPSKRCVDDESSSATSMESKTPMQYEISGILCHGDSDEYSFDVDASASDLEVVTTVKFEKWDIGKGKVKIELLKPNGAPLKDAIELELNSEDDLNQKIQATIPKGTKGTYKIKISSDESILSSISYDIHVSVLDEKAVQLCKGAPPLTEAATTFTIEATSANSLGASCATDVNKGTLSQDAVYSFTLDKKSKIELTVSGNNEALALSLRSECLLDTSEVGCYKAETGLANSFVKELEKGTYYVVVQTADGTPFTGDALISLKKSEIICTPNASSCSEDKTTLSVCNSDGTAATELSCGPFKESISGCKSEEGKAAYCLDKKGKFCQTPEELGFNTTVKYTFKTEDLGTLYAENTQGSCTFRKPSAGKDYYYSFELAKGEAILVDVKSTSDKTLVYIIEDSEGSCDLSTCKTLLAQTMSGQLLYANTSDSKFKGILVVDSTDADETPTVTLKPKRFTYECPTPGEGLDCSADKLVLCSDNLTKTEQVCPLGCDSVHKECKKMTNSTCDNPTEINVENVPVKSFKGNLEYATADYDLSQTCALPTSSPGNDVVYKIKGIPASTLQYTKVYASVSGHEGLGLYITDKCPSESDVQCVVGSNDSGVVKRRAVSALIPENGELFVVVDAQEGKKVEDFELVVSSELLECKPNEATCENSKLTYCTPDGKKVNITCPDGKECNAEKTGCEEVKTNSCPGEKVEFTHGAGSINGNLYFNEPNFKAKGCYIKSEGRDALYKIEIPQGKVLTAELTAKGFDGNLWLSKASATCDDIRCIASADAFTVSNGLEAEKLVYKNDSSESDYYLIVDTRERGAVSGDFFVSLKITDPPTYVNPTCDIGLEYVERMYADGLFKVKEFCPEACDVTDPLTFEGECLEASYKECSSAKELDLTSPVEIKSNLNNFGASGKSITKNVESCGLTRYQSGQDAVYSVTLEADDLLEIDYNSDFSGTFYITNDCDNVETNGCLLSYVSKSEKGLFTPPAAGTYYLVVKSKNKISKTPKTSTRYKGGNFTLKLKKTKQTSCTANTSTACNSGVLSYCDSKGKAILTKPCVNDTCSSTVTSICEQGDGTLCADPIRLNDPSNSTQFVKGKLNSNNGDSFSPPAGTHGNCTIEEGKLPTGDNTYYSVKLSAGQTLHAALSSDSDKAALFLLEQGCSASSCKAMSGPDYHSSVSYTATDDQEVILSVDSFPSQSVSPLADFWLSYWIEQ